MSENTKEHSLVSVIIPCYNAAAYVREAIDSALAQTYPNVEIVVVNDGSTNNVQTVLESYIQKKSIIYIHQENKGLSGARNTGIKSSHGEFIALLDADDMFLPNKLERQVGYLMAHPDCAVSYCDVFHYYEEEPEKMLRLNYDYPSGDAVFPALLYKNFVNPLTVVLRRSVFDRVGYFDEPMKQFAEDWDFWVRAAYAGMHFDHLPETLAKYRMRKTSLSYNRTLEVKRKSTVVHIFERLSAGMTPEERARYHMSSVLFHHRIRLWYAKLAEIFPVLARLHQRVQKKRLGST